MARFLFLDDDLKRHRDFAKRARKAGHEVVYSRLAIEAMAYLRKMPRFDVVFLDRDLHIEPPHEPGNHFSGETVANYIASIMPKSPARDNLPKKVVVHSQNPERSVVMVKVLQEAGIPVVKAPFLTDRDLAAYD